MATLELYQDDDPLHDPPLLEGQMTNSGNLPDSSGSGSTSGHHDAPFNTLDEPIRETVWRDVKAVGIKFKHVLYPVQKKSLLKVIYSITHSKFTLIVIKISIRSTTKAA